MNKYTSSKKKSGIYTIFFGIFFETMLKSSHVKKLHKCIFNINIMIYCIIKQVQLIGQR